MARKPDWDQERRERRAREHGRERSRIDESGEAELDAVARARFAVGGDDFHERVEPARQVAREWRELSSDERRSTRSTYLGRVRAALESAAQATHDQQLRQRITAYYGNLARLFRRDKR